MSKLQEERFEVAFEPAERELRRVLGGSVSSQQFYSCVAVIHSLAEQVARRQ